MDSAEETDEMAVTTEQLDDFHRFATEKVNMFDYWRAVLCINSDK